MKSFRTGSTGSSQCCKKKITNRYNAYAGHRPLSWWSTWASCKQIQTIFQNLTYNLFNTLIYPGTVACLIGRVGDRLIWIYSIYVQNKLFLCISKFIIVCIITYQGSSTVNYHHKGKNTKNECGSTGLKLNLKEANSWNDRVHKWSKKSIIKSMWN